MSDRPSASVATIGLPIASASNAVSGVPSHSDGNTTTSSAESTAATSRWNPRNVEPIAETERLRLRFERRLHFAFAGDVEARVGLLRARPRRPPATRYSLPFDGISRVTVPTAQRAGRHAQLTRGPRDLVGRCAAG